MSDEPTECGHMWHELTDICVDGGPLSFLTPPTIKVKCAACMTEARAYRKETATFDDIPPLRQGFEVPERVVLGTTTHAAKAGEDVEVKLNDEGVAVVIEASADWKATHE